MDAIRLCCKIVMYRNHQVYCCHVQRPPRNEYRCWTMLKDFRYEQHCDMQDLITLTAKCVHFLHIIHTCRLHPGFPNIFIADISQRSSATSRARSVAGARSMGAARSVSGARSVAGVRAAQRFDTETVSVTACAFLQKPTPVCIDDGQDTPKACSPSHQPMCRYAGERQKAG
jgi:hypothetical protein